MEVKGIKHVEHLDATAKERWGRHIVPHGGAVAGGQELLDDPPTVHLWVWVNVALQRIMGTSSATCMAQTWRQAKAQPGVSC